MHSRVCSGVVDFQLGENSVHVWRAIHPDNIAAPPHVSVDCASKNGLLHCRVEVHGCDDARRILTFRNTIDDLIIAVRTALEAIRAARR